MADRRDFHCILNNESIQDDMCDLMLAASSIDKSLVFKIFVARRDKYFIHDKMITNMAFLHCLLKTSELKQSNHFLLTSHDES